jgi:drug/metabolite transporter (DMT)-like permease
VFVAIIGMVFFSQIPSVFTWIGAAVIFASGIYVIRREHIAAREGRAKHPPPIEPPAAG